MGLTAVVLVGLLCCVRDARLSFSFCLSLRLDIRLLWFIPNFIEVEGIGVLAGGKEPESKATNTHWPKWMNECKVATSKKKTEDQTEKLGGVRGSRGEEAATLARAINQTSQCIIQCCRFLMRCYCSCLLVFVSFSIRFSSTATSKAKVTGGGVLARKRGTRSSRSRLLSDAWKTPREREGGILSDCQVAVERLSDVRRGEPESGKPFVDCSYTRSL